MDIQQDLVVETAKKDAVETLTFEDSKLFACFALQIELFVTQASKYAALNQVVNKRNENIKLPLDEEFPLFLKTKAKRFCSSGNAVAFADTSKIDDIEVVMMHILDGNGKVSVNSRMEDFVVMMTRCTYKLEHRMLCYHILTNCCTVSCLEYFNKIGGLLMIKRWLKMAAESQRSSEIVVILDFFYVLPLDTSGLLKRLKIGKALQKLQKHENGKIAQAADRVRKEWGRKSVLHANGSGGGYKPPILNESEEARVTEILKHVDACLVEAEYREVDLNKKQSAAEPNVEAGGESDAGAEKRTSGPVSENTVAMEMDSSTGSVEGSPQYSSPNQKGKIRVANEGNPDEVLARKPVAVKKTVAKAAAAALNLKKNASANMIEANNSTSTPATALPVFASFVSKRHSVSMANALAAAEKQNVVELVKLPSAHQRDAVPSKSILKKVVPVAASDSETGSVPEGIGASNCDTADANKDQKMDFDGVDKSKPNSRKVFWADSNESTVAGSAPRDLVQVHVFEIEEVFKRKVDDYKSIKEKEKRERQSERESRLLQVMPIDVEWERPAPLLLPNLNEDDVDTVVASDCKLKEDHRLKSVIEERYYSGKPIPADPGRPPNMAALKGPLHSKPLIEIPDDIPGALLTVVNQSHSSAMGNVSTAVEEEDPEAAAMYAAVLEVLPPLLRTLDKVVLQHLVSHEDDLMSLLNPEDGSVNEYKVKLFLEDFYMKNPQHKPVTASSPPVSERNNYFGNTGNNNSNQYGSYKFNDSSSNSDMYISTLPSNTRVSTSNIHRPPHDGEAQVCKYFNSKIGCMRGDQCKFLHRGNPAKKSRFS